YLKKNNVKGIKLHAQYNKFNVKIHKEEITRVLELIKENKMIALFHTGSHFNIKDLAPIIKQIDDLPIILGHSGLAPQVGQAIALAINFSNVYLETSGQPYDYLIEYMIKHPDIGVERVLYGSDLPTLDPTVEMSKILTLDISESEKQMIFYENMQKLLEKGIN
ncbi:MAG: amidohydrolase family protein, partial [Promethearchaeota archaeon]